MKRDTVDKPANYAEARAWEYWIVAPESGTIVVLEPKGGDMSKPGDCCSWKIEEP